MWITLKQAALGKPAGERLEVDDKIAQALVTAGAAEPVQGDPLNGLIEKSMEGILANLNKAMSASIDGALKEFAKAATKSRKNAVPAIFGANGDGDPRQTFGSFLLAVRKGDRKALEAMGSRLVEWGEDTVKEKAAMTSQTGAAGGYTVPAQYYEEIMEPVIEMSIVRPRATYIPMTSKNCFIPAIDVTTAPSSGDTAFLGGLTASWTEEAATLTEKEPAFKQVELINYELSGYSKLSNTLLADSAVGLEAFLYQLFAKAISWYEDYAFLRGSGAGKPLGAFSWAGLISVTRNTASHLKLNDFADLFAQFLPGWSKKSACWVTHPTALADILTLASTAASGQNLVFERLSDDVMSTLGAFGLPICVTEKMVALGTKGDLMLADWAHYLLGDRQQIEIAFSEHAAFTTNQTIWRFVSRVAGMPWLKDKITLADATSTISPFLTVAT